MPDRAERVAWPRKLRNFPIILMATIHQYVGAVALMLDAASSKATNLHILHQIVPRYSLIEFLLFLVPTIALLGFFARRKVTTLICLVPQQLLLFLSAGSAVRAIALGSYPSGVFRSPAYIAADESLTILIAIFHTWAMLLILRYSDDRR